MSLLSAIDGVPTLSLGSATPIVATIASSAISSFLWQAAQQPPSWGVFDSNNNLVVSPDSVLEFEHEQEYDIANFPIQAGQFASYNKVIEPFEIRLRFSKGGTEADRAAFLADIQALVESIDLYLVVTPERTYRNVNLKRSKVARDGVYGAYFLTEVDLYFVEILQVTAQYTTSSVQLPNAQSGSAQPVSNVGNVSPVSLTLSQVPTANAALSSLPVPSFY